MAIDIVVAVTSVLSVICVVASAICDANDNAGVRAASKHWALVAIWSVLLGIMIILALGNG